MVSWEGLEVGLTAAVDVGWFVGEETWILVVGRCDLKVGFEGQRRALWWWLAVVRGEERIVVVVVDMV